jgi:hypothetical protein
LKFIGKDIRMEKHWHEHQQLEHNRVGQRIKQYTLAGYRDVGQHRRRCQAQAWKSPYSGLQDVTFQKAVI